MDVFIAVIVFFIWIEMMFITKRLDRIAAALERNNEKRRLYDRLNPVRHVFVLPCLRRRDGHRNDG